MREFANFNRKTASDYVSVDFHDQFHPTQPSRAGSGLQYWHTLRNGRNSNIT
jgi:hypothetical protein